MTNVTAQQQIQFLSCFIETIENVYADGAESSDRLVLVLKIFLRTLKLRAARKAGSLEWLPTEVRSQGNSKPARKSP
jgi:hypothetical protein